MNATPLNGDPPKGTRQAVDPAMHGPLASSVRLGFVMLYAAVLLLGAGWASSNFRQVPPDSRAVVLRFGQVNRVQESGLLLAWPRPIEQVRLLPAADRQIAYKVVNRKPASSRTKPTCSCPPMMT